MTINQKPITLEQAFGLTFVLVVVATLLAFAAEIFFVQGLGCIPMYGAVDGLHADALAATGITAVLSLFFVKTFRFGGRPHETMPLILVGAAAIGLGLYLTLASATALLTWGSLAETTTYTVSISRVEGSDESHANVEEPDCLWAYHFANPATGLDDFQCTESDTPFKVGTKMHVVERSNFFGSCTMKFAPATGRG